MRIVILLTTSLTFFFSIQTANGQLREKQVTVKTIHEVPWHLHLPPPTSPVVVVESDTCWGFYPPSPGPIPVSPSHLQIGGIFWSVGYRGEFPGNHRLNE